MKRIWMKKATPALGIILLTTLTSCTYNTKQPEEKNTTTASASNTTAAPGKPIDTTVKIASENNPVSDAWLLVPGQSAGLTNLNENAAEVYQRFGKPDDGDAAMQKAVAIWFSGHDSTKHSTAIYTARDAGNDPAARVKQIRITSPSFITATGIHTGSTLKEIKAAYPVQKGETYTDDGVDYRVFDSKKGIAFEIAPDGGCVAIIIHEADVLNGGSTYLKFRTTNKFLRQQ